MRLLEDKPGHSHHIFVILQGVALIVSQGVWGAQMFGLLVTVASDTTTDGEPLFFAPRLGVEVSFGA